jgi:hypothetical protein
LGFVKAKSDTSLFVFHRGLDIVYLLLYVDDIVLTTSSDALLRRTITTLQQEFSIKDLGRLHHFLGLSVSHQDGSLFLSQHHYAYEILKRAGMTDCKSCSTPVDTHTNLSADGPPVVDLTHYRSLVGALQYLTFTHPDIAFTVQQVCLYMHDPRKPHMSDVKHILRYLQGTLAHGLLLQKTSPADFIVYTDADWASCPGTRKSTSGYSVFLGNNLISWSSKR